MRSTKEVHKLQSSFLLDAYLVTLQRKRDVWWEKLKSVRFDIKSIFSLNPLHSPLSQKSPPKFFKFGFSVSVYFIVGYLERVQTGAWTTKSRRAIRCKHHVLSRDIVKFVGLELGFIEASILENFALNGHRAHTLHRWCQRARFKYDVVWEEISNAREREVCGCEEGNHGALGVESVVAAGMVRDPVQLDSLIERVPSGRRTLGLAGALARRARNVRNHDLGCFCRVRVASCIWRCWCDCGVWSRCACQITSWKKGIKGLHKGATTIWGLIVAWQECGTWQS